MSKHSQTWFQRCVECFLLSIGKTQLGIKQLHLGTLTCIAPCRRHIACRGFGDVPDLYSAEGRKHVLQHALLRLQALAFLCRVKALYLHVHPVAFGCRTTFYHRLQLALVATEQFLQVFVKLYLLVEHQQGEIHLVHPLAHTVERDVVLGCLNLTLFTRNLLLTAYHAAVIHRLTDVYAYPVLILAQSLHIKPQLLINRLHLVRPCRHVTLIRSLRRGSHLRQPCLAYVLHRQRSGLLYQTILPYQRIVALRSLLTLLQCLPLNRQRQRHQYEK